MKRFTLVILLFAMSVFAADGLSAQRLEKLGKKAKEKIKQALEDKTSVKPAVEAKPTEDTNSNSKKTLSKRMSSSEVMQTLDNASSSFSNKDYSDSRYSIHEALIEIEHQLGEKVLAEMPTEALGQSYDKDQDVVISTGVGFIGLEIGRLYPSNKGNIRAVIANNSAIMGPYSMALSNPQYISQNENMKSVTVDGRRGILELSGDTYKLALPFGQSSVFLLECVPCSDESKIISLAGNFDLGDYLEILGEAPIKIEEN